MDFSVRDGTEISDYDGNTITPGSDVGPKPRKRDFSSRSRRKGGWDCHRAIMIFVKHWRIGSRNYDL
jgi:hypothetical protein